MTRAMLLGALAIVLGVACSGGGSATDGRSGVGVDATVAGSDVDPSDTMGSSGPAETAEPLTADAATLQVDLDQAAAAADGTVSSTTTTVTPSGSSSTSTSTAAPTTEATASITTAVPTTGTPETSAPATTAAPTTEPATTSPTSATGTDASNPIAVPGGMLAAVASSGPARCVFVDLQGVPVPPNPGYAGETVDGQTITGDELWATTFYLMLYSNCERQARGLEPFRMYPTEKQLAMQQTVLGISESHGGFGDRADIAGGLAAEGHGGGPRPGEAIEHDTPEDSNGDGVWSPNETGRRAASGNQSNGNSGLVDHGDAMIDPKYTCIFAAASLGQTADHRVDVIIYYGNRC
ncbi:MAG: hypothetical protein AAF547_15365 [Actinomycetota bacterium]